MSEQNNQDQPNDHAVDPVGEHSHELTIPPVVEASETVLQDMQRRSELFKDAQEQGLVMPGVAGTITPTDAGLIPDQTERFSPVNDMVFHIPGTDRIATALAGDVVGPYPIDWDQVKDRLKERGFVLLPGQTLMVPGVKLPSAELFRPEWVTVSSQLQGPIVLLNSERAQPEAEEEIVMENSLNADPALYEAAIAGKKHPQFILAMDASYFEADEFFPRGVQQYPIARLIPRIQSHLVIRERGTLEKEENYRQLLPYMIVTTTDPVDGTKRYWPYLRTPKVGEERLVNKVSVGFGGHIDIDSVIFTQANAIDLDSTIRYSNLREKEEELKEETPALTEEGKKLDRPTLESLTPKYSNYLIVSDDGVDKVHLGIIMELEVPSWMRLTCAEEALVMQEKPLTVEELLFDHRACKIELESWSYKYLMKVFLQEATAKADALDAAEAAQ